MEIVAYTDGSYREVDGFGPVYSGASVICRDGADPVILTTAGTDPEYIKLRNVAGELLAVMQACEYCMNTLKVTQNDLLVIVHDYTGIANWCRKPGEKDFWRAKNPVTAYYRDYMNTKMKTRCQVLFRNVKGHQTNGNAGNAMADSCAAEAIDTYVSKTKGNGNG